MCGQKNACEFWFLVQCNSHCVDARRGWMAPLMTEDGIVEFG